MSWIVRLFILRVVLILSQRAANEMTFIQTLSQRVSSSSHRLFVGIFNGGIPEFDEMVLHELNGEGAFSHASLTHHHDPIFRHVVRRRTSGRHDATQWGSGLAVLVLYIFLSNSFDSQ